MFDYKLVIPWLRVNDGTKGIQRDFNTFHINLYYFHISIQIISTSTQKL